MIMVVVIMMIVVGFRKKGLRRNKMMRLANQKDNISSTLVMRPSQLLEYQWRG